MLRVGGDVYGRCLLGLGRSGEGQGCEMKVAVFGSLNWLCPTSLDGVLSLVCESGSENFVDVL